MSILRRRIACFSPTPPHIICQRLQKPWRGLREHWGAREVPKALFDLAGRLGAKRSLREIGMPEDGIERVVETTMAAPYWNPRPPDPAAIRSLLVRAWRGEPPQSGD